LLFGGIKKKKRKIRNNSKPTQQIATMTSSAQPSSSSSSSLATTRPSSKPLPPPLDDPSVSIPLLLFDDDCDENNNFCPPLNWGMIGCGRVCHDFVQALKHLPTAKVVACATANDPIRAAEFATKHKIPTSCKCFFLRLLLSSFLSFFVALALSFQTQ